MIAGELTDLGCSYDLYTRTTTANHYAVAQELFTQVWKNGYMVEQTTQGAISPSTGRTLPDRYIEGTCPICGYGEARGDQCDNCGNQLDPTDLIDPRSRINGETPVFVETQHFLLDLPALADALRAWLEEREASGTWRPNVIKFSLNILDDIRPRAMTRDIDWGIPVPLDGWRDNPTKRLYVWFDAVVGYLSASVEWARRRATPSAGASGGTTPRRSRTTSWARTTSPSTARSGRPSCSGMPGKGSRGGEPGVFGELNLPTEVVSSEYLTMEGKQFSTSRGYTILVRDVLERYGPDGIRYFICAAGPENQDANFTWRDFVQRNNSELVAGWGNLVSRTAAMVAKNFGEIPQPGPLEPVDEEVRGTVLAGFDAVGGLLERHRQKAAIAEAMRVVGEVNAYVSRTEPFKLKGDDQRERLATVLHTLVQCVSDLNTMLAPFLPHAANRVRRRARRRRQLHADAAPRDGRRPRRGRRGPQLPRHHRRLLGDPAVGVAPGRGRARPISKPAPVFTKLDESVVDEELARAAGRA